MSFRTTLFVLNGLALVGIGAFLAFRVLSLRRNPGEPGARNLVPYLPDEDLETRRLDRALGWSLVFTLVIAIALPVYFIAEPFRQEAMADAFLERSIERGKVLFANSQSEHYDSARSLLCADCHGGDATGGSAPFVLQPELDKCLLDQNKGRADVPECLPKQVSWQAPDLTLAALRYDREQLIEVITYGRPGTPMPAWGIASGVGVLNEQGVTDLVNYLESVKVSAKKAQADAAKAIAKYKSDAADLVTQKRDALATAQAELAKSPASATTTQRAALQQAVATAQAELAAAIANDAEARQLTDGAVLFRLNCARCHTKGWSYHVTQPARTDLPRMPAQGSGAYGPNLTNGDSLNQFPGQAGEQQQFNWVALGAPENAAYGTRGISSGRMPHFGQALTEAQIKAIVAYERSL